MTKFLTDYTLEHKAALDASSHISWDLQTTGLSPTSRPITVGSDAMIGHANWNKYKTQFKSSLNCRVRPRISTVALCNGTVLSWDLDALSVEDRSALIWDTVHGRVLIGHHLTCDLTWAMSICGPELQPEFILDTMLLVRCLQPERTFSKHLRAAQGDLDCVRIVQEGESKTTSAVSLDALCAGAGLGFMEKSYQHPRNWAVTVLSEEHHRYAKAEVLAPRRLISWILKLPEGASLIRIYQAIIRQEGGDGAYMRTYSKVPVLLSRMSTRGIPLHLPSLETLANHYAGLIPGLVKEVVSKIAAMGAYRDRLASTQIGGPDEMKRVMAAYAFANGFKLRNGKDGEPVISSKAFQLIGASKLDGWIAWEKLQGAKEIVNLCSQYKNISIPVKDLPGFRKLHPLMEARAVTLRVASEVPNVQNMPRQQPGVPDELQLRSIIRAPAGYVIVSADYGQIELRIAAALALRAVELAKIGLMGADVGMQQWVINAFYRGADMHAALYTNAHGFDGVADKLAQSYRNVLVQGAPMAKAFRAEIDPHLLTGLGMAVNQGVMDIGGVRPLDYLISLTTSERADLRKNFQKQRQSAKALNFGLLFGMQAPGLHALGIADYGLAWTLEEASEARAAWFALYPEIEFWQQWNKYVALQPARNARPMYLHDRYSGELITSNVRLGISHTLAGRPVVAELPREVGNYADQGSCADMMLDALLGLPKPYQDMVMNTIHDEILLLVPLALADQAKEALLASMIAAADRLLAPFGIPAQVEPSVGDFWN